MTRQEAIRIIENRDSIMDYCENQALSEALDVAVQALSAIDEIRAEIKELRDFYFVNFQGYSMTVAQQCLDIIDKNIGKES